MVNVYEDTNVEELKEGRMNGQVLLTVMVHIEQGIKIQIGIHCFLDKRF